MTARRRLAHRSKSVVGHCRRGQKFRIHGELHGFGSFGSRIDAGVPFRAEPTATLAYPIHCTRSDWHTPKCALTSVAHGKGVHAEMSHWRPRVFALAPRRE